MALDETSLWQPSVGHETNKKQTWTSFQEFLKVFKGFEYHGWCLFIFRSNTTLKDKAWMTHGGYDYVEKDLELSTTCQQFSRNFKSLHDPMVMKLSFINWDRSF